MHSWLLPLILAAGSGPAMETDKLALPGAITTVVHGDVNGDGNQDLLIFWRQGEPPEAKDRVSVFFFQEGRFKSVADQVLTLPSGSVVFDAGDADLDKLTDVVVLKSNGLWALKGTKEGLSETPVQLVRVATVAAFPREKFVPREKLLIELEGGRIGALLPTVPIGLLSFYEFQTGKGYVYRRSLRVPSRARIGTAYTSMEGMERGSTYSFAYPRWTIADSNGDQYKDLVFIAGEKVAIFRGGADGSFKQEPDLWRSFELPKSEDEDRDERGKGSAGDVNGDKRVDLVFSKTESKGLVDFGSRIWVHLANKDGSYAAKPDVQIKREGIGTVGLKDLNDDGSQDLVITTVDLGVGSIVGMLLKGGGSVDVVVQFYLWQGNGFPEKPDGEYNFEFEVTKKSRKGAGPVIPVFGWDFDSDGKTDMASVDSGTGRKDTPDRLVIKRGTGSGIKFSGTIWKQDLPAVKSLTAFRLRKGQSPSLLVQLKPKEKNQGDLLVLRNLGTGGQKNQTK